MSIEADSPYTCKPFRRVRGDLLNPAHEGRQVVL
jgi:hypothetical protein